MAWCASYIFPCVSMFLWFSYVFPCVSYMFPRFPHFCTLFYVFRCVHDFPTCSIQKNIDENKILTSATCWASSMHVVLKNKRDRRKWKMYMGDGKRLSKSCTGNWKPLFRLETGKSNRTKPYGITASMSQLRNLQIMFNPSTYNSLQKLTEAYWKLSFLRSSYNPMINQFNKLKSIFRHMFTKFWDCGLPQLSTYAVFDQESDVQVINNQLGSPLSPEAENLRGENPQDVF